MRWIQWQIATISSVLSPYSYCGGNPICHRDEEGKFINNIIGAVIGGAADLGVQVASNLIQGKTAFEDINWVSVGASTLEGGLTSGLSAGRTLAVKASVALAGNTTKTIMDGKLNNTNDVLSVAKSSITEIVSEKVIGKAGKIVGKGIKSVTPGIDKAISQKANKVILSNNKATDLAKKLPGVSNTKVARAIATSENRLVDASKTVSNTLQKAPENVTKFGLKIIKKENEK